MNKIIYISNVRLPTEKAHGIQIMKMCEAFAELGQEVVLVVPRRFNKIKENLFDYYKIKKNFRVVRLPVLDLVRFGRFGFWLESASFAVVSSLFFLFKTHTFLTRDELVAYCFFKLNKDVVWEGHMGHTNWFINRLITGRVKMVMITNGLKDFYVSIGAMSENILVASDAVDVRQFKLSISKTEARQITGLPVSEKIVLYAGHLYEYTGINDLLQASKDSNFSSECIIVGGTEVDVENLRSKYGNNSNIKILGKKPHAEIPFYLKSADVLVMPYSSKTEITKKFMSPLKLFEYMASGVPIVASDMPSIREVLSEETAFFFEPDNPIHLADTIKRVLVDSVTAERVGRNASIESENHPWSDRAKSVLDFVKK